MCAVRCVLANVMDWILSGESMGFSGARGQRPDLHVPFGDGARHVELQVGGWVGVKKEAPCVGRSVTSMNLSRFLVDVRSPFSSLFWIMYVQ